MVLPAQSLLSGVMLPCKLSACWKESMSKRSIINTSAAVNFSVRICSFFKTSVTTRYEIATEQVSVTASPKNFSQCSYAH